MRNPGVGISDILVAFAPMGVPSEHAYYAEWIGKMEYAEYEGSFLARLWV